MKRWLLHPWLSLGVRLVLGGIFVAAALPKLADPPGFAKAVWAYDLVPPTLLNPMALVLPWLELVCGLALVAGWWRREAALWLGALLLAFCLAVGINLVRRHPVDCGCFGASAPRTEPERLADMRWVLARDLALLLLVLQVGLASANSVKPE